MKTSDDKYDKVVNLLRKSKPILDSTEDIELKVMRRIKGMDKTSYSFSNILDFLFGWVYIVWVRRSLIAGSIVLVLIFVYQQGIILNRIDVLSRQTIVPDKEIVPNPSDNIDMILMLYKNSGRKFPGKTVTISETQMKELLETVKELQIKYKDLENIIEANPELKKQIEKKLLENEQSKINL